MSVFNAANTECGGAIHLFLPNAEFCGLAVALTQLTDKIDGLNRSYASVLHYIACTNVT